MVADCGSGCQFECMINPNERYMCPAKADSPTAIAKRCNVDDAAKGGETCMDKEQRDGPCGNTEGFFCGRWWVMPALRYEACLITWRCAAGGTLLSSARSADGLMSFHWQMMMLCG